MADLVARPDRAASSATARTLTELHHLCSEDYTSNAARRAQNHRDDAHLIAATPSPGDIYVAAAVADHLAHCTNCREQSEAAEARYAAYGESIARRDRIQLGLPFSRAAGGERR